MTYDLLLTARNDQNLGQANTNCTASNRLLLPLPFLPTTTFISDEKGCISGCCLNERKFDRVMDLICILFWWYYYLGNNIILWLSLSRTPPSIYTFVLFFHDTV
jgi:hypothetical protein